VFDPETEAFARWEALPEFQDCPQCPVPDLDIIARWWAAVLDYFSKTSSLTPPGDEEIVERMTTMDPTKAASVSTIQRVRRRHPRQLPRPTRQVLRGMPPPWLRTAPVPHDGAAIELILERQENGEVHVVNPSPALLALAGVDDPAILTSRDVRTVTKEFGVTRSQLQRLDDAIEKGEWFDVLWPNSWFTRADGERVWLMQRWRVLDAHHIQVMLWPTPPPDVALELLKEPPDDGSWVPALPHVNLETNEVCYLPVEQAPDGTLRHPWRDWRPLEGLAAAFVVMHCVHLLHVSQLVVRHLAI